MGTHLLLLLGLEGECRGSKSRLLLRVTHAIAGEWVHWPGDSTQLTSLLKQNQSLRLRALGGLTGGLTLARCGGSV